MAQVNIRPWIRKITFGIALLSITLLLTACPIAINEHWQLDISNSGKFHDKVTDTYSWIFCEGALEAKVIFPNRTFESGLVTKDNHYQSGIFKRSELAGQSMIVEAWCFAEDKAELGYVKAIGTYRKESLSGGVSIRPNEIGGNSRCLTDVLEARGERPCIFTSEDFE